MGWASPPPDRYEPESLYAGITRWAGRASVPTLALLAVVGPVGATTVLLLDWHRWPFAGLLVTAAAIGGWGLLEQRAPNPHTGLVRTAEHLLAGLGMFVGAVAALGLLFALLGPAPNL